MSTQTEKTKQQIEDILDDNFTRSDYAESSLKDALELVNGLTDYEVATFLKDYIRGWT